MDCGVKITYGVQDYQIFQQDRNGYSEISLGGQCFLDKRDVKVYVKLVAEDTGESVINWQPAVMDGKRWSITLKKVPAGGLYRIETGADYENTLTPEWYIRGDMPKLGVHLYANDGRWKLAAHPLNDSTDTVYPENCEVSNCGHSPYLHFAKILNAKRGYPIGLIAAALGGSSLSAWIDSEDGVLYRSMINKIRDAGGAVKGILWYQGCSDTLSAERNRYAERFLSMVEQLRKDTLNPELVFLTVQLNRYKTTPVDGEDEGWSIIREQQRLAAHAPGVYIVSAIDLPLSDMIHISPAGNIALGERLAVCAALSTVYQNRSDGISPDIQSAVKDGNTIVLTFANMPNNRLSTFACDPGRTAFSVCNQDGDKLALTGVAASGNTIVLTYDDTLPDEELFVTLAGGKDPLGVVPVE